MEELFSCYHEGCEKCFNSKYNLVRHINTAHLGIKRFVCSKCSKRFANKQNLKSHESSHQKEVTKAAPATRVSSSEFLLSDHYRNTKETYHCTQYTGPLPSLPAIHPDRRMNQEPLKIPIIPSLLPDSDDEEED